MVDRVDARIAEMGGQFLPLSGVRDKRSELLRRVEMRYLALLDLIDDPGTPAFLRDRYCADAERVASILAKSGIRP